MCEILLIWSVSLSGVSAQEATEQGCMMMTERLGGAAGAITVSNKGNVGVGFTAPQMPWAYREGNKLHYGINRGEHFQEDIY